MFMLANVLLYNHYSKHFRINRIVSLKMWSNTQSNVKIMTFQNFFVEKFAHIIFLPYVCNVKTKQ